MLPQVAQGALAVECRAGDAETIGAVAALDDPRARVAVEAERAFLRQLGGGCDLACGALATVAPDGTVSIEVMLGSLDGHLVLRTTHEGSDPVEVGTEAARILLDECGGRAVLEDMADPPVVELG
jgi:hydroxymethylbilane synthase